MAAMTEDELQAIEARANDCFLGDADEDVCRVMNFDVPALVAEVRNLRWVLSVIREQGDGAWANLARHALQPDTDLAKLKERWTT